jgi:hypothetical protein
MHDTIIFGIVQYIVRKADLLWMGATEGTPDDPSN